MNQTAALAFKLMIEQLRVRDRWWSTYPGNLDCSNIDYGKQKLDEPDFAPFMASD